MTNRIGQSLGRYQILEQLGEGGMAVVYKALDTRLERNVAIKVILPTKEHSAKFIKRFEREAKSLAGLSHPNIVKVIDYGEHDGLPYLVMEYIPGGTLKSKLGGKPMPWHEAAVILIPIARALGYAHNNKIIHRDIKPSNILITQSGEPMLSDFGIAKLLEGEETLDLTGTGVGVGTPEYMSPEQAQGNQMDARSDVYSLGIIFYEMIIGRKPYQADTPYAVVIKHVNEPLPNPRIYLPWLPEDVENILQKALAKNPENRFSNMAAFVSSLEKVLRAADSLTRSKTKLAKSPLKQRRPWLEISLSVVVLLIASGVMLERHALVAQMSRLISPTPTITPTTIPTPTKTYLADLSARLAKVGWGEFSVGEYEFFSIPDDIHRGDPIILMGKLYDKGLFAHAPSLVVYDIDGKYIRFESVVGKTGDCGDGVVFKVIGDSEVIYEGKLTPAYSTADKISVDVSHVNKLQLVVDAGPAGNIECDQAI